MTTLDTKLLRFVAMPSCPCPIPQTDVDALMQTHNYEIFNALIEGAVTHCPCCCHAGLQT